MYPRSARRLVVAVVPKANPLRPLFLGFLNPSLMLQRMATFRLRQYTM
jgi:hypothetical protein